MKRLLVAAALATAVFGFSTQSASGMIRECAGGKIDGEYFHPHGKYTNAYCFLRPPRSKGEKGTERRMDVCVHPGTQKILHVGKCTAADAFCVHPLTHKVLHKGKCRPSDTVYYRRKGA